MVHDGLISIEPHHLRTAAYAVTAPLALGAAARLAGFDRHPLLAVLNAGTPFAYLPAYAAAAVGVVQRHYGLATVAGSVALAHLAWTAPELRRRRPVPESASAAPRLRLVSSNIRCYRRDSSALGEELAGIGADILLLQELTPQHLISLKAAGAFDDYDYSHVDARTGTSFGSGIWSRYPLVDSDTWLSARLPMTRATVDIGGSLVDVFNVHLKAPMRRRWIPTWKTQLAALEAAVASAERPVILAGDFNSTYGHEPFRKLLAAGLRDAHVEVGRGLATTWPRGGLVLPPLFRLDHVLVSDGVVVLEATEGDGPGSDHRPVIAEVALVSAARAGRPASR